MGVVTIREFNTNISKFVARAEAGEVIKVARNGKVVAELRPPAPDRADPQWQQAYQQLCEAMDQGIPFGRTFSYDERTS